MDAEQIAELYSNRFPAAVLARKQAIWQVLCRHYLQRYLSPGSKVLDLASGYGEFINNIEAAQKYAVDINPDSRSFLSAEVEFIAASADAFSAALPAPVDAVFASNFFEHLPDKAALEHVLTEIHRALEPGGKLLILGPNLRYLPGEYWDYYDHHLGLTHLSFSEVLQLKGYRIERCVDRFLPYTTQGALPTHPLLVRLYLANPWAWRVLGKQFFIVATKTGDVQA